MAQSVGQKPLVSLSTTVEPAAKIDIDGTEYEIYGQGHIGKEEEVKLMTLFKSHERAQLAWDASDDDESAGEAYGKMYDARINIITTFSDIPEEVAKKLSLKNQGTLLDIIAKEMGFAADDS